MKKLFYFTALVFIVSIILYSCNKDENPATSPPTGGTPSTIFWKGLKKTGLNIPINPGVTEDTLNAQLSDFPATNYIKNLNVTLDDIEGVDASKLKFEIVHGGKTVRIIDTLDRGGPANNFTMTVISDSSSDPIKTAFPPFTGTFAPFSPLSAYRDSIADGIYTLRIINSGTNRAGVIKSWGVTISYNSPAVTNYCLEFNGTNQYASVPNFFLLNNILERKTFTIEGWYYIMPFQLYNYFSFLDKRNSWYCEYFRNDTAWTFVVPGYTTPKAKFPWSFDEWHHLAISYDSVSRALNFYVDGVNRGSGIINLNFTLQADSLYIARGISGANEYGRGRIDELRIWNVVRTPSEILDNYRKSLTGNENGLILYYKFNEGAGNILNDATPNGNNGFIRNNPIWTIDGPNITP